MVYSPGSAIQRLKTGAGDSFLESPDNYQAQKAVVDYIQDRGLKSFAVNTMELSVNRQQ